MFRRRRDSTSPSKDDPPSLEYREQADVFKKTIDVPEKDHQNPLKEKDNRLNSLMEAKITKIECELTKSVGNSVDELEIQILQALGDSESYEAKEENSSLVEAWQFTDDSPLKTGDTFEIHNKNWNELLKTSGSPPEREIFRIVRLRVERLRSKLRAEKEQGEVSRELEKELKTMTERCKILLKELGRIKFQKEIPEEKRMKENLENQVKESKKKCENLEAEIVKLKSESEEKKNFTNELEEELKRRGEKENPVHCLR